MLTCRVGNAELRKVDIGPQSQHTNPSSCQKRAATFAEHHILPQVLRAIFHDQCVVAHAIVDSTDGIVGVPRRGWQRDAVKVVARAAVHVINAVGDQRVIALAPIEVV